MRNIDLPDKLPSGDSMALEHPPIQERGSYNASADSLVRSEWYKMIGSVANLSQAIPYIVGYSQVTTSSGNIFNPTINAVQGPYYLTRKLPARHPLYPNMFATKILSASGIGYFNNAASDIGPHGGKQQAGGTVTGTMKYVWLCIQFEAPRYLMLSDGQMVGPNGPGMIQRTAFNGSTYFAMPEYRRYTEFFPESNVETLARPGVQWVFSTAAARATSPNGFAGDRILRQAKGKLRIMTYDVHQDYILLGRLIPSNFDKRLSTLNSLAFPQSSFLDQNENPADGIYAQYEPGTLLLEPQRMTPRAQAHPAVMSGQIDTIFFPRTVDVEANMLIFDPPSHDPTTVDLRNHDGNQFTPVRGWNLVPLPTPIRTPGPQIRDTWVCAQNDQASGMENRFMPISVSPLKEEVLLYQYSNYENLWQSAESVGPLFPDSAESDE